MIFRVLATVTSWDVPAEPHPPIGQVLRTALVDDVTAWSGLPRPGRRRCPRLHPERTAGPRRGPAVLAATGAQRQARAAPADRAAAARLRKASCGCCPGARIAHSTFSSPTSMISSFPGQTPASRNPSLEAVKAWHKLAEDHLEAELGVWQQRPGSPSRPA